MIPPTTQQAMKEWLARSITPAKQLDRRWIERYRDFNAQDSFWWLSWAGLFTKEELQQWDRLFHPPLDEATKAQLAPLAAQSREREFDAALAEQREPRLQYPAIEIDDVRRRIAGLRELDAEIEREEPHAIVRQLYHDRLQEDIDYDSMIEAAYEGERGHFWGCNQRMYRLPTSDEMTYAFAWVRRLLQQGFERSETAEISQELFKLIQDRLHLSLDLSVGTDEPPVARERQPVEPATPLSGEAVRRFYEAALREGGYEGWSVSMDAASGGVSRVESASRQLILSGEDWTIEDVRIDLAHELAGHVARSFAGEHSPIGLLGIGTKEYPATEEGLALYYQSQVEVRYATPFDDSGQITGMLAMGLASGVVTPPLTFLSLSTFIEQVIYLYRRLLRPWNDPERDRKRAREYACYRCLRTFRGVPQLEQAGVCYLQDTMYLRSIMLMRRLVAEDETILDRMMVGKVAYDLLPVLEPLHLTPSPQPLRELAFDPDLDQYILSFETNKEPITESP